MSSWDPFPSKVFCVFSWKLGMTGSMMRGGIKIRLPWSVRAGVEVIRSPREVILAPSHRCLVKGGVLWSEATLSECWSQLWSKQHSPTFKQTKASPSCRFQIFLSPTSGAERSSFLLMTNMYTRRTCLCERNLLAVGLALLSKICCCPTKLPLELFLGFCQKSQKQQDSLISK